MISSRIQSWREIWEYLFEEACSAAESAGTREEPQQKALVAIILARTAIEVFMNEFVERRNLSPEIKGMPISKKIVTIHQELNLPSANPEEDLLWMRLRVLSKIRNHVVHHNAHRLAPGEAPSDLQDELEVVGFEIDETLLWEDQVLTRRVAIWACRTAAECILYLEEIPARRKRSMRMLRRTIKRHIRKLDNSKGDRFVRKE